MVALARRARGRTDKEASLHFDALPKTFGSRPQIHKSARRLLVFMTVCALMGPLALVVAASKAKVQIPSYTGPGPDVGISQAVVSDMIAGRPTDIPRAKGVPADLGRLALDQLLSNSEKGAADSIQPVAATDVAWVASKQGEFFGTSEETDTFFVAGKTTAFDVSVIIINTAKGPVLGALPSILPASAAHSGSISYLAPPIRIAGARGLGRLDGQIDRWAQAYASGNGADLASVAQDASHIYRGLGGFTVVGTPSITSWYKLSSKPVQMIVQVTVTMQSDKSPDAVVSSSYDLLVGNLAAALPAIEAWGPAGSGPSLYPYENAA